MPADEVTHGTDVDESRVRTGPRHAAPRKPLFTRFHMPAGKAIASVAMPTAVLMGFGFTSSLAIADTNSTSSASSKSLADDYKNCVSALDSASPSASASDKATDSASPSATASDGAKDSTSSSDKSSSSDSGSGDAATPTPSASKSSSSSSSSSGSSGSSGSSDSGSTATPSPSASASSSDGGLLGSIGDAIGSILSGGSTTGSSSSDSTASATPSPSASASSDSSSSPSSSSSKDSGSDTVSKTVKKVTDTVKDTTDTATKAAGEVTKDVTKAAGDAASSASPSPSASSSTSADDCKAATDDVSGVDNKVAVADDPWYLSASSLTLKSADYQGIVEVKTASGKTKKVLKYVISGGTDIGDLHQTVKDTTIGKTYHVQAASGSKSTITGGATTMYTESISGNLFGLIPITFDVNNPPPLNIPLIYFTNVKVTQAAQFGGTLHVPGMHVYTTDGTS
ncbi:hypothetical protein [Streptomyces sp900105755]|uniref:Membrane-bound hydrophilic protein n=1 Tax=Streptomyces sp. 900105755 TaxID=3154389 RepID=A0ABV1TVJ4_9ACTN